MRCYFLTLFLVVLLLTKTAHSRRRSRGRSRSRSARVSQIEQQPWGPQRVVQQEQQQEEIQWTQDPWMPQQVQEQTHWDSYDTWTPQIRQQTARLEFASDPWLPDTVEQTQLEQQVPDQQPAADDCIFDYDEVPEGHEYPFLVGMKTKEVIYPDRVGRARVLLIPAGTKIIASCPGPDNVLLMSGRSYSYFTCENHVLFYGRKVKKPVQWSELGCQEEPKPTLQTEGSCGNGGVSVVVGWEVRRRHFLPQITLCFDEMQETTRFASHKIHGRYIDAKVIETSRPSFKKNDMFSISVRNLYRKTRQRRLLQRLLNTTEYLTGAGQHYLARGHLAPDADFVLEAEQDATYYYANVVPQWQDINNGNWKRLEGQVRELAEKRPWPLEVWTGTHGTLQLPNQRTRNPVTLFLGLSVSKKVVPVPALLWKVIHDPQLHQAVAIVMVNNVRERGTSDSWQLDGTPCRNLCNSLRWVNWDINDLTHGMTFCCSVDALRSIISDLPVLGQVELLRA